MCERLSSTRPVNEAKQGEDDEERQKIEKRITEKQTQGFGECGEVGVGEGKGGDLSDGNELFGNSCGEHSKRCLQGNGKRGFWETKEEQEKDDINWISKKEQRKAHLW